MSRPDPQRTRDFALEVLARLREAGFEAYWAGGCVRDSLLGRLPKDYDVATNARPEQVRNLFGNRRTLAIGAAFGVIAVVGRGGAGTIEVTTFRSDEGYSDARHPDAVHYSTAEADAQRRDFTINGMFFDPLAPDGGRVIDYVGGLADLENRLVRAIGDPRARFHEDRLRLLRAVRFAATFDFALEEETWKAIRELAPGITAVSAERIAQEMRLMLVHANRARAMDLLRGSTLLAAILPESQPAPGDENAPDQGAQGPAARLSAPKSWRHTLAMLDRLGPSPDENGPSFSLALAALVCGVLGRQTAPGSGGDAEAAAAAERVCRRWRLSNQEIRRVAWLVRQIGVVRRASEMTWPRLQRLLITEGIDELLALAEADALAAGERPADVEHCRRLLALPEAELNPPPLVTGDDLIAHGVPPGKGFATLLERVRDAQLLKEITTKAEALALVDRLRKELGA
ncbi:MAG: CCA tRNA nucleotidyltransferase [Pirellulales bacterium]